MNRIESVLRWINIACMHKVDRSEIMEFIEGWADEFARAGDEEAFAYVSEYAEAMEA